MTADKEANIFGWTATQVLASAIIMCLLRTWRLLTCSTEHALQLLTYYILVSANS